MARSLRTRLIGVLAIGFLVGAFAVVVVGPLHPPDREGRLVVDASYLRSVVDRQTEQLGHPPDPSELARALETRIDADVLAREAALRGLVADSGQTEAGASERLESAPVGHLQRVAATRWLASLPTDTEAIAFAEFRRDRYAELITSERGLPAAGDPAWISDPELARLLARARADVRAAERLASRAQFLAEIAARHPIALSRSARTALGEGTRTGTNSIVGNAPAAAGSAAWPVDPVDSWSGAASVFVEQTQDRRYDVTVLLPPGTADDGLRLSTACGPDENRAVVPVFAAAEAPDLSWRVARGTLQCPAGTTLRDDMLRVSAPGAVRGDLEVRRIDGAIFVATFESGGRAIDLSESTGGGLAASARKILRGAVDVLGIPALWMLGLAVALSGPGTGALSGALVGFGTGYGLGRWTAGTGGPTTAFGVAEMLTLCAVAVIWGLSGRRAAMPRPLGAPIALFGLLGLLFGGTAAPILDAAAVQAGAWLDGAGGIEGSIAAGLGAALAVVPMVAAGVALASLPRPRKGRVIPGRLVGQAAGVGGVAWVVLLAYSSFVAFSPQISGVVFDVAVLAAALAVVLAFAGLRVQGSGLATAGTLVILGLALPVGDGWGGYPTTFASGTLVSACLFAAGLLGLGATMGDRARWSIPALLGVGALGSLMVGLHLSAGGASGAALSTSALGSATAVLTLGWLAAHAAAAVPAAYRPSALRVAGLAALALAVLIRLPDYRGPFAESVRADLAFGQLPIPVVALALGTIALLLMPRRRRVPEALGMRRRNRRLHLWYAASAVLLLPFGVLRVPLPIQAGSVPAEADAQRIVGQLLTDTYEAFDLTDEEALYDRLAESVTGELLPTLFLENRRGLISGAGDVDEVSVLDVAVAPGAVSETPGPGRAFTWTGEWAVRARVTHLVHVHMRENLYTGRVTVRAEPGGWKMDAVELTAEERVARPWGGS